MLRARRRPGDRETKQHPTSTSKEASKLTMPKSKSTDNIIMESEQIGRMWSQNQTFLLGELTLEQFRTGPANLRDKNEQLQRTRAQLTADSNAVNDAGEKLNALNTRVRSGVRAVFGPNSNQYEQVGGTRSSERKRPARKLKPGGSGSK